MVPSTTTEWVAWLGVVVPLLGLAGSAIAYVIRLYSDARAKRYETFFHLMASLDDTSKPIAGKMAAAYHLRNFPEHKEFIIRFCEGMEPSGTAANLLKAEFDRTANFLRTKR